MRALVSHARRPVVIQSSRATGIRSRRRMQTIPWSTVMTSRVIVSAMRSESVQGQGPEKRD